MNTNITSKLIFEIHVPRSSELFSKSVLLVNTVNLMLVKCFLQLYFIANAFFCDFKVCQVLLSSLTVCLLVLKFSDAPFLSQTLMRCISKNQKHRFLITLRKLTLRRKPPTSALAFQEPTSECSTCSRKPRFSSSK